MRRIDLMSRFLLGLHRLRRTGSFDVRGSVPPKTLTGAEYVRQITSLESDRRARSAFQDLVLRIAPPGAALFDFGAGPGIDARFFAECGFPVEAYDVDPKMREFFTAYCRDLIDSGRVTLDGGTYREFLTRKTATAGHRADLIISNFAPLNLVDDLHELFAKFHELTGPDGKVLASVLSPYFIGDMRYRWWWRNAPRLWRDGHYFMPGPQAPHIRRRLADFIALSSPYFKLASVFRGLPSYRAQHSGGVNSSSGSRYAWCRAATSRFMFLLFEKRD
jgi:SAM-dependent methyltransferase